MFEARHVIIILCTCITRSGHYWIIVLLMYRVYVCICVIIMFVWLYMYMCKGEGKVQPFFEHTTWLTIQCAWSIIKVGVVTSFNLKMWHSNPFYNSKSVHLWPCFQKEHYPTKLVWSNAYLQWLVISSFYTCCKWYLGNMKHNNRSSWIQNVIIFLYKIMVQAIECKC